MEGQRGSSLQTNAHYGDNGITPFSIGTLLHHHHFKEFFLEPRRFLVQQGELQKDSAGAEKHSQQTQTKALSFPNLTHSAHKKQHFVSRLHVSNMLSPFLNLIASIVLKNIIIHVYCQTSIEYSKTSISSPVLTSYLDWCIMMCCGLQTLPLLSELK